MEQVSMVAAEVLLSKRVQEMVLNGEEPPPPYVCRDDGSVQCVPSNICSLPIIDFDPFTVISQTPTTKQKQELEKLQSALSSWGCFQVINYGISVSLLDKTIPHHLNDSCLIVLQEYTVKTRQATELISKAMAKSLNLEENCFLNQFGVGALLQARFNYYSCSQRRDLVLGLKPHADGLGYTIILQDDVEGLQVHKDGKWFTVPAIPHALLVLMAADQ